MSQHDYVIANGTGAAVRSDLNGALAAIVTQNSGATAPSTTYAYQWWADTTTGLLKLRNAANNAWITLFQLDGEWSTLAVENGTAAAPSIYFKDSGTDTGIYSPGTDQVAISTAGTGRLFVNASGNVGLGTSSPSQLLHVSGGRILCQTGNENFSLGIARSGSNAYYLGVTSSLTPDLLFSDTNGNTRMVLTDSGRLGIGATPSSLLDVRSGSSPNSANLLIGLSGSNNYFVANNNIFQDGASNEKARIDSSGRLLVGTSSSRSWGGISSQFQIENTGSGSYTSQSIIANTNDTVGGLLVLGKSRGTSLGSNTAVQNNDLLGRIYFYGADGSQLVQGATIEGWVDGTPGANDMPGRLVFSTTADGASSPTERMRINSTGELWSQGTSSVFYVGTTQGAGTTNAVISAGHTSTSITAFTVAFRVWSNGNVVNTNNSYGAISDVKLKENIVDAGSQWDDLKAFQVRKFNFKEGQIHTQIGLIAQEAELVSPGLVYETPDRDAEGNDLGTVTKSVNYSVLYMKAVKALQEAMERIEQLESEMAAVKSQLS
jgi:hypothetical protein